MTPAEDDAARSPSPSQTTENRFRWIDPRCVPLRLRRSKNKNDTVSIREILLGALRPRRKWELVEINSPLAPRNFSVDSPSFFQPRIQFSCAFLIPFVVP